MELTGRTKTDFKKWYNSRPMHTPIHTPYSIFMGHCDSMKYGVLVDYFDSVGIYINIDSEFDLEEPVKTLIFHYDINSVEYWESSRQEELVFKTRPEAINSAIEKANELRNEQLK